MDTDSQAGGKHTAKKGNHAAPMKLYNSFLPKYCIKKCTCCVYCERNTAGKNGSVLTIDSGVDKHW